MKLMKKLFGAMAALLAVVMLTQGASAVFSGTLLEDPTYSLAANGFTYKEQTVIEAGVQKLYYGEYNATAADAQYEWVIHSIRDGSKTTLTTVMDIAKDYEEKTGQKVMFATNGDYFDFGSGTNMESYVNDGIVLTKGAFASKHCIGFDNKGKVVVGRMTEVEKRLMIVRDGKRTFFEIDAFDEQPGENGIAIYAAPGTYTVKNAGKYICTTNSPNLKNYPVWGTSQRMKTGEVVNDDSFTLKSGQFAVVVRGEQAQYFFDNIFYGVEVDLVEIPGGAFQGCTWVLGGYDILVDDGKVNTKCHTDNDGAGKAPRTFIGVKADGTTFVCAVDGRGAGGSTGFSVNKEAELAAALGAKYALELDGGGSTTAIVRIGDKLTLRNSPSDGSMRCVSNAIMLVEKKADESQQKPDENPGNETTAPTTGEAEPPTPTTTAPEADAPTTNAPTTNAPTNAPTTKSDTETPKPEQNGNAGILIAAIGAVAIMVVVAICIARKGKQ